jgi:hypothetical protein
MEERYLLSSEQDRPRLWNPNAASCWSFFFSPVLGAYLHAANWSALGRPERAKTNLVWMWAMIAIYLIDIIIPLVLPLSEALIGLRLFLGFGMLLGWYFSQGRAQAFFVKEKFGDDYVRKGWWQPLISAGSCLLLYYLAANFAEVANQSSSNIANNLAASVKPLILKEWQKEPELQNTTIEEVILVHKAGNTYEGILDATFEGKSEKLRLEVTFDGQNILWKISE